MSVGEWIETTYPKPKKVGSFTALNLRRNIKKFDLLEMTSVRDGHLILFKATTSQQQTEYYTLQT